MTLRTIGIDALSAPMNAPDLAATILAMDPDVVLLDLFLTDSVEESMAALGSLARAGVRVVVVTATPDPLHHARSMELGAVGVLEKSVPVERLIDAVQRALRREPVMSPQRISELRRRLADSRRTVKRVSPFDLLTGKEQDVLRAMMDGYAAGRIARDQHVSVLTIRSHIRSILSKLDVHSQLEAVSLARRESWFPYD